MSSSRPTDETTWAEGGASGGLLKQSAQAHNLICLYTHTHKPLSAPKARLAGC